MHARAAELIETLDLEPHPEGGHYRRVHRSAARVQPLDERSERAALTTIFFLLTDDEVSRWHSVASDEAWHHYEGDALELYTCDRDFVTVSSQLVGPLAVAGAAPVHVVPAGQWQAARTTGRYSLLGCTVGPGFDFADFRMLRDLPARTEAFRQAHPEMADLI